VSREALAAGRQIAVDFAAYDYRHLQDDFRRVVRESTGSFRKHYETSFNGVQDLIIKAKAVSQAEVDGAGVVDASGRSATVVVAVSRTVKNTSVPKGQTDSFGLQIVLRHVGDRWLATQVTPL
jgi:Mce-associated membrane protein